MSNSKGNPGLEKYRFKTDQAESCTVSAGLSVTPSLREKLRATPGWQKEARKFLTEYVETISSSSS